MLKMLWTWSKDYVIKSHRLFHRGLKTGENLVFVGYNLKTVGKILKISLILKTKSILFKYFSRITQKLRGVIAALFLNFIRGISMAQMKSLF